MATGVTSSITSNVTFSSRYQLTTDDDILTIQGAVVTLIAPQGEIFTREGDDTVRVEDSTIEAKAENQGFYLGDGNDTLSIRNSIISTPVYAGEGNDYIRIEGTLQSPTKLNKTLSFGNGNDTLELVSILENASRIEFGSSGTKTLRFNGGAHIPVQLSGSTYGTISTFTNLEVTLSGGTTGCNLDLAGEQTGITLNGNLFGTTNAKQIAVSGSTTTLSVLSNVRTNVHLRLNNMRLIQVDGAILEFSDHSGYAVIANDSVVNLRNIVVKGGQGLTGSNTVWTVENSDFSNSKNGIDLTGGTLDFRNGGVTNCNSTGVILNSVSVTGSKMSLTGNQMLGAMRTVAANVEILDFRANSNMQYQSAFASKTGSTGSLNAPKRIVATAFTSAYGGAVCQSGGSMTLTSATFSSNKASAYTSAYASGSGYYNSLGVSASAAVSAYAGALWVSGGVTSLTSAAFAGNAVSAKTAASANHVFDNPNYTSRGSNASACASAYASGGAICQNGGNMILTGAVFSGNVASASASGSAFASSYDAYALISAYASGGAICQNGGNMTLSGVVFSGNVASSFASGYASADSVISSAYSSSRNSKGQYTYYYNYFASTYASTFASAYGGALFLSGGLVNMENTEFTGNRAAASVSAQAFASASKNTDYHGSAKGVTASSTQTFGGALYLNKTTLNYLVTSGKKLTNNGNTAQNGGWLYADDQSTVNITVESGAILTIGLSASADSIAGSSNSHITKQGTGYILVNSDISGYKGLWTVAEGTLELAGIARMINLDNWTIGTNATLILSINDDTINMNMSKKIGIIDMGGGADTINTGGYDLTEGTILLSDLALGGGGRVSVKLRNRSMTEGSTLRLNNVYLDSEFTGNDYTDTILVNQESTLNGAFDLKNGNNVILATAATKFGNTLTTGSGNDTLTFKNTAVFSNVVSLGNGTNTLTVAGEASFSKALNTGSGKDTLVFSSKATFDEAVDLGDGTNSLTATGDAEFSKALTVGSGDDTLNFATVTFEDTLNLGNGNNTLTASAEARFQDIFGGTGNDSITLNGDSTISGEISLGTGTNSIHVNKKLTADRIRIANNGQTTVYVYYRTTLADNSLTVYSDEQSSREAITLSWSDQSDLDKVRILVSHDRSSFQNDQYDFAVELYNQSKSFTLNLQKGYYIQFQAQDDNGWKQRMLTDTTAPDQVTGLTFDGTILSWDEAQDNPGGNGVKQYHVEIAKDTSFSTLIQSGTSTATTFSLNQSMERQLYFRVSAEDYTGNIGAWSETVSGMFDTVPPTIPGGAQSAVDGYSAVLSWSASTDGGSGVSYYEYRIASDSDFGQIVTSGSTNSCSITVGSLKYGTYYWQVRATDVSGNCSDWSESRSFSTVDAVAPGTPTNLAFELQNEVSLSATWDAVSDDGLGSGLNRYEIQLATNEDFSGTVQTISVTTAGVTLEKLSNATYYMRVRSVDNAGNRSGWTETASFVIAKNMIAPTVSHIQADITTPTKNNVIVTATFEDDVEVAESLYRIGEPGEWKSYVNGVTVTDNAIVYFKAIDNSGNESEIATYVVANIDRTPPAKPTASANITSETLDNVVVTAVYSDDSVEKEYSLDGYNWSAYTGGVAFENNGYVYFRGIDAAGNISDVTYYAVNNIVPKYVSNVVLSGETTRIVSSGQTYGNTTVNSYASFYISSGGVAIGTLVNSGGTMSCYGVASDTTVKSGGKMSCFGGEIVGAVISSGGSFALDSLGTARDTVIQGMAFVNGLTDNTTVNVGGRLVIMDGKTTNIIENGGFVDIFTGASASFASNTFFNLFLATSATVHYHTTATRITIVSGGILRCCGGEANTMTVLSGGTLFANAGMVNDTTLKPGGRFICYQYADAKNTVISSGGVMHVSNGGEIKNTTVSSGGSMYVSSGGKLTGQTTIEDGAVVSAYSGAVIDFDLSALAPGAAARINYLSQIYNWSYADFTLTVSDTQEMGTYQLAGGVTGFNKTITVQNSDGEKLGTLALGSWTEIGEASYKLSVQNSVLSLTIAAKDPVAPTIDGITADITAPTNQDVTITAVFADDVELVSSLYRIGETGTWQIYVNGVTVSKNAVVYFKAVDAAGNETETSYTVDNIDKVAPPSPTGLMAVVSEQTVVLVWNPGTDDTSGIGNYVVNYSGNGRTYSVAVNNTNYVLTDLSSGTWNWSVQSVDAAGNVSVAAAGNDFTVKQSVEPEPDQKFTAKSDIDGNGISDVMFVWTGNNYQYGYWMNGTSNWQSVGVGHPAEWENLGCHDMAGDGKADSVLVGNVVVNGVKGAYIGYYTDANDADANWTNIGYLNNVDDIDWKNKVGNLTGGTANSIVWYAPELYTVGAWTDGTSNWVTMTGNFGGDDWQLVGCGDFDGDGKDSVVMSGANGTYFYTADLDGTVLSMGAANWVNWEVRAIGDFAGDGKDDIVLFNTKYGSMVMLADGNLDDFTSIGQLDAKDWFVVGAGDYNGDQKDDLLVRQYSTGMLGYYTSGDTSKWVELGRGVDMNWTVIA